MKSSSHISIVIPTYNQRSFIKECIESSLAQKVPSQWNFSVIVVDDGSTDGTNSFLIKEFGLGQHPSKLHFSKNSLFLLTEKNNERAAVRNKGAHFAIKNFKSDWLLFLDGDDVLAEDSLKSFIKKITSLETPKDCVALYSNLIYWYGESHFGKKKFTSPPPEGDLRRKVPIQSTLSIGTTLVSAKTFQNLNGFLEIRELSGSEDWELWCRLAFEGSIFYSNHVSLWYRKHGQNTPGEQFETSISLAMEKMALTLKEKWKNKSGIEIKNLYSTGYLWISGSYNSAFKFKKSIIFWLKSFWIKPSICFSYQWGKLGFSIFYRLFLSPWKKRKLALSVFL